MDIAVRVAREFSKLSFKSRQYVFDIEQKPIDKPQSGYVDLMIGEILKIHQPKLQLPRVRVSRRMRTTLGSYMPSRKQIAISSRLLAMGHHSDVRAVVLHEVVHAIVHARFGNKPSAWNQISVSEATNGEVHVSFTCYDSERPTHQPQY